MQRVRTAVELEHMSPAERSELFDASVVTDLRDAPTDLVDRTRARLAGRIDAAETPAS
jgi:hypothetical protein